MSWFDEQRLLSAQRTREALAKGRYSETPEDPEDQPLTSEEEREIEAELKWEYERGQ